MGRGEELHGIRGNERDGDMVERDGSGMKSVEKSKPREKCQGRIIDIGL